MEGERGRGKEGERQGWRERDVGRGGDKEGGMEGEREGGMEDRGSVVCVRERDTCRKRESYQDTHTLLTRIPL